MKSRAITLGLVFFIGLNMVGTMSALAAEKEVINWRVQCIYSPTSLVTEEAKWWANEIEKRSGGKLVIQIFPKGQILKPKQTFDGVAEGVAEGAICSLYYFIGKCPEGGISWIPGGATQEEWKEIWLETDYKKIMNEALAEHNIRTVAFGPVGPYMLLSNFPVNTLEDIKGKRIKADGIEAKFWGKLGAGPVSIAPGEIYMAMQRGTIDGIAWPPYTLRDYKFWEVCKYVNKLFLRGDSQVDFFVNLKAYNALPDDIKKIMGDVDRDLTKKFTKIASERTEQVLAEARKRGLKIIIPPEEVGTQFRETALPIWEEWAAKTPRTRQLVDIIMKARK